MAALHNNNRPHCYAPPTTGCRRGEGEVEGVIFPIMKLSANEQSEFSLSESRVNLAKEMIFLTHPNLLGKLTAFLPEERKTIKHTVMHKARII